MAEFPFKRRRLRAILLAAGLAGAGMFVDPPARLIRVLVIVDQSVETSAGSSRIESLLRSISSEFEREFALGFTIASFETWQSETLHRLYGEVLHSLIARLTNSEADILIAVVPGTEGYQDLPGLCLYREGVILIQNHPQTAQMQKCLKHELAHLFGAVHLYRPDSVMDGFSPGLELDALTKSIIRIHRRRAFHRTEFPLAQDQRKEALRIYGRIVAFNRLAILSEEGSRPERPLGSLPPRRNSRFASFDDAFFLMACIEYESGRVPEARKLIQKALAANPINPHTWVLLGNCCWRTGHWPESIRAFQESLRLEPANSQARGNLTLLRSQIAALAYRASGH